MAWRREKASCRINKPVAWSTGSSNVGAIRARRQQTKMKQVPNENETIAPRACKTAVRAKRKCRRRAKLLSARAMQRTIAMQNEMGNKKGGAVGIRTWGAAMQTPRTSQLSWLTFSYREQAQPYLLGAKKEN